MIDPALQLEGVATVPLNATVLVPCVTPKFVPVMVTTDPTAPDVDDNPEMFGVGSTVNTAVLLDSELLVTMTFPLLEPAGTTTEMLVGLQETICAPIPSNVTTPDEPKLAPFTVMVVPTGPADGEKLAILGNTVNDAELLLVPAPVFTITCVTPGLARLGREATMEVSVQLTIDATTPAMVTSPDPWAGPRFVPEMVNCVP
jgi:hypothetical protein